MSTKSKAKAVESRRNKSTSKGRAAQPANGLAGWREHRRLLRESRLLLRECRRILRKHRARIRGAVAEEINQACEALALARKQRDRCELRAAAEVVDELLGKHLAFARKSAFREYAESIGVAVFVALLLRAFVVEAFKIPSGSMIPTLKIGDHIFVNKFLYGIRLPMTNIKFFDRSPQRGDVVVFVYPVNEDKDFIKRIVAIGGDTVAVRDNVVYVNGEPIKRRRLGGNCKYLDGDEDTEDWQILPCQAYEEQLGEHRYRVIQRDDAVPIDFPADEQARRIPKGHVFVMGDNRDNSHDSRIWGTVPHSHIKGKAMITWWSRGEPEGIRWRRFFHLVHSQSFSESVVP